MEATELAVSDVRRTNISSIMVKTRNLAMDRGANCRARVA
jgi:hypothetical protein